MPLSSFYDKTSTILGTEKTLILEGAGTVLQFPLNMGSWNEIRLGIFGAIIGTSDGNAAGVAESFTASSPNNFFCLGIKDNSNIIPGSTGSTFFGLAPYNLATTESISVSAALRQLNVATGDGASNFCNYWKDTTNLNGNNSALSAFNSDPTIAGSYAFKTGVILKVNNRGLATQTLQGRFLIVNSDPVVTGYTIDSLRSYLNTLTIAAATARTANNGSVAHAVPDTFYLRWPFTNNRLRLSALVVEKYS
jgi:hypothetical protein